MLVVDTFFHFWCVFPQNGWNPVYGIIIRKREFGPSRRDGLFLQLRSNRSTALLSDSWGHSRAVFFPLNTLDTIKSPLWRISDDISPKSEMVFCHEHALKWAEDQRMFYASQIGPKTQIWIKARDSSTQSSCSETSKEGTRWTIYESIERTRIMAKHNTRF